MKVPKALSEAFLEPFQELLIEFLRDSGHVPADTEITSPRFLRRSILPHVKKLSALFNRTETDGAGSLEPYWKSSANPENLRLAYFLSFMPPNLFRVASIWAELMRLGYSWTNPSPLRAVELGAGPAAGACGIAAAESLFQLGLPRQGNWALIEQDRSTLNLGSTWARRYFEHKGLGGWDVREFHRKLSLDQGLLPRTAPKFHLWVSSFFLNELKEAPQKIAEGWVDALERHLEDEGIVILVEPALKLQSRKLLAIRAEILKLRAERNLDWLKILLPCLGHQNCGAFSDPEDWCHEDVVWWRPPYFRTLDDMADLDRKSLQFSYLVLTRSHRTREEILPALADAKVLERLVSPSHGEGKDAEFFICGATGKFRVRARLPEDPNRGDILIDPAIDLSRVPRRIQRVHRVV